MSVLVINTLFKIKHRIITFNNRYNSKTNNIISNYKSNNIIENQKTEKPCQLKCWINFVSLIIAILFKKIQSKYNNNSITYYRKNYLLIILI